MKAARAAVVEEAWRALSDGNRRRILTLVRDRPASVGEVAEKLGLSQQIASHHLRVLRGAGLVSERRERTRHLFVVRADGLAAVSDFLEEFWPSRLRALKHAAESGAKKRRG